MSSVGNSLGVELSSREKTLKEEKSGGQKSGEGKCPVGKKSGGELSWNRIMELTYLSFKV